MKVICLLCDSLNRHFLSAYGADECDTPHLDWLASRAHVFNNHFSGSLPTMPTRREVWTGNYEFLWRPWGALEPWDRDLIGILRDNDVLTMLITDSYHLFEHGSGNYHFKFEGWEFFRGFENDPWVTDPVEQPPHAANAGWRDRYGRNMTRMQKEENLPAAETLRCVERWLQKNYTRDNFFLMVDEFAPHEPFNTPEAYWRKYDPDYEGPLFFWPGYGKDKYNEAEIRHLRAAYKGHVEFLDKYIGRVFETMTNLNMWEDTAFMLMTDHGHYLGEHGNTGKPGCPVYNTLAHIPFMLYVPGHAGNGARVDAVSANVDVFSTILDLFGLEPPVPVHGRSLLPLVAGRKKKVRDWTLYGYFGRTTNITDGKHTYLRAPRTENAELYIYSLRWEFGRFTGNIPPISDDLEMGRFMPNVDMPVTRLPVPPESLMNGTYDIDDLLFNLKDDQRQQKNLAGTGLEKEYIELMRKALKDIQAPDEQIARMGL